MRRGALDKEGAEVVGGVVVVRFGENPLQVIKNVKAKIKEISPGLPTKTLPDGRVSQVKIVPFYDRTDSDSRNAGHSSTIPERRDTGRNHCGYRDDESHSQFSSYFCGLTPGDAPDIHRHEGLRD